MSKPNRPVQWIAILCGLVATASQADTGSLTAFVEKTMVTADASRGGCMMALSADPASVLPACKKTWVTFSCDGTYTDPVRAFRMLDQAQLAIATGMKVQISFTDEKTHDGFCFVERMKLINE
jgi:hypothetical protein